jgi:putative oxidoreductase
MASTQHPSAWEDLGKLVLRLSIGVLLLLHGVYKLRTGIGWMSGPLGAAGLPSFIGYGVFVGEVIAPLLLIAGKWSRLAGIVVAFNMFAAIMLVQRAKIFQINPQGGAWAIELEMLFLLGGVAIFFLGAGGYSVSRGQGRWD